MITTYTLNQDQVDNLKKTARIPLSQWGFYDAVAKNNVSILKEEFGGGPNLNI